MPDPEESVSRSESDGDWSADSSDDSSDDSGALVSRLRVIEDQPLTARASAYVQIHDELQAILEGGDSSVQRG